MKLVASDAIFLDLIINSLGSSLPVKEVKQLGSVYIPYVEGVSEKFKCKETGIIIGQHSE
jgi:hypothetical protein